MRRFVGDIDLYDMVQVSHPSIRPVMGNLILPIGLIILPSVPGRRKILFCLLKHPVMRLLPCGDVLATKLGPYLQPFAVIADVRMHGAFKISEAALIRRIMSKSGLVCLPHWQSIVP